MARKAQLFEEFAYLCLAADHVFNIVLFIRDVHCTIVYHPRPSLALSFPLSTYFQVSRTMSRTNVGFLTFQMYYWLGMIHLKKERKLLLFGHFLNPLICS